MPGIVRSGDAHVGHASPTPNPFHQTTYVPSQSTVYVNGKEVIRKQDSTSCGDPVAAWSPTVFVEGKEVHRLGDATDGHGSWVPNAAATSSGDVFADHGGKKAGKQGSYDPANSIAKKNDCQYFDWNNNVCLDQSTDPDADYYVGEEV